MTLIGSTSQPPRKLPQLGDSGMHSNYTYVYLYVVRSHMSLLYIYHLWIRIQQGISNNLVEKSAIRLIDVICPSNVYKKLKEWQNNPWPPHFTERCLINCDPTSCFHTRLMAPCPRRVLNFHFLSGEVINLQERKWYVFAGSLMYIHQSYMMTTKLSHIPIFIMLEQASTQPQEVHREFPWLRMLDTFHSKKCENLPPWLYLLQCQLPKFKWSDLPTKLSSNFLAFQVILETCQDNNPLNLPAFTIRYGLF